MRDKRQEARYERQETERQDTRAKKRNFICLISCFLSLASKESNLLALASCFYLNSYFMKNLLLLPLILLFSCGPQERVSKEAFEDVQRNNEVKRITEVAILQEAMVWGDSITQEAQVQLIAQLQQAIASNGPAGAIDFCKVNALPILQTVESKYTVTLRRASVQPRNPADTPNAEELPLLEAYAYNAENNISSDPSIQKIEQGEVLLYTKPILLTNALCLSCHGDPKKDIAPETSAKLKELYPQDSATGYAIGDLRGMWALRLPKKEVVKRL